MPKEINIDEALRVLGGQFIDVRSPAEFREACIPGALNIPLFTDEEREIIGTLYKQESPDKAKHTALKYVAPKLPELIERCQAASNGQPIILYCWRGGMRSKSLASMLDIMGVPSLRLIGGYKAYRRFVNRYFAQDLKHRVVVIHGLTGVGKTQVIEELQKTNVPAVDLEGLANNRGSVFGQVGMQEQPSQKMFEALLAEQLRRYEGAGYIVVEGESRRIGRLILPEALFKAMHQGLRVLLYCSIECRIDRIKKIYTEGPNDNVEALLSSVGSLAKRLGKNQVNELQSLITKRQFDEVIRVLLVDYYDPLYNYPDGPDSDYDISINSEDPGQAAAELKEFLTAKLQGGEFTWPLLGKC